MCELVDFNAEQQQIALITGSTYTFNRGGKISGIGEGEDTVLQCWHPETEEWSTMLPPVEGMAWELSPGSKIRVVNKEKADAPAPSMVEQVEAVGRT